MLANSTLSESYNKRRPMPHLVNISATTQPTPPIPCRHMENNQSKQHFQTQNSEGIVDSIQFNLKKNICITILHQVFNTRNSKRKSKRRLIANTDNDGNREVPNSLIIVHDTHPLKCHQPTIRITIHHLSPPPPQQQQKNSPSETHNPIHHYTHRRNFDFRTPSRCRLGQLREMLNTRLQLHHQK